MAGNRRKAGVAGGEAICGRRGGVNLSSFEMDNQIMAILQFLDMIKSLDWSSSVSKVTC